MTREEEIINAATEARMASAETLTPKGTHISIDDVPFINKIITYDEVAENAFIKGAKWADEHPKSPQISVKDDLPCNHEELIDKKSYQQHSLTKNVLVESDRNGTRFMNMIFSRTHGWRWRCIDKIIHWMPIPKLPKEQEIKL